MRVLARLLLLAGAWYLSARGIQALAAAGGSSPPSGVPVGVGLGGLLLLGPAYWPAVFAASLAFDLGRHCALSAALVGAAGNAAATGAGAWLLRRSPGFSPALERFVDAIRFVVVGFLVPLAASLTSAMAACTEAEAAVPFAISWRRWLVADLAGVLLAAPAILAWLTPKPAFRPRPSSWEVTSLAAATLLAMLLSWAPVPMVGLVFFPLVAWAAVRSGLRASSLVTVAGVAATLVAFATAPGGVLGPESRTLLLSALAVTQSLTGLLLAASTLERERSEAQERQVNEAYRALLAGSPIAIAGLDAEGRVAIWSRAAERLFGWREAEVLGQRLPIVPPDREGELAQLRDAVRQGAVLTSYETVRLTREGRPVEVALHAWPLPDGTGCSAGIVTAMQDITERKAAERLQRAIYRIALAAQAEPSLDALYGAIHTIVGELMPAANFYLALLEPETGTLAFPYFVDQRDERPAPRRLGRGLSEYVLRTGRPLRGRAGQLDELVARGEVEVIGTPPADWLGVPLRIGERTIGVLAVQSYDPGVRYTDRHQAILEFVSAQVAMAIERKRAEQALRASEAEFRALFAAMRDVILVLDRDGRYLRIAPNAPELLYRPAEEMLGRRVEEILPADAARPAMTAVRQALERQGPATCEYGLALRGEERWFQAVASPMTQDTVIFVARDVTEQRRAEQALREREAQLRQAMKMEAVGRLAGGVAHDFNNLLTAVLGHADLALARLPPDDPLAEELREIKAAGGRAASLTRQLLAFSRKQVLEPRIVDLNAVVMGLVKMLRRTIGEDIELVTRLAPDLGRVRADPVQLEQVLLNLAVNGRDAMPDGGRLTIETANAGPPPVVRVSVSDTGVGMSEDVLAHLFEPFFTTKEQGKGTGLGLATVYGIVQQSGGTIAVHSTPGCGTTFVVDLPRVEGEAAVVETGGGTVARTGWETILLVEDDEAVRGLTRRVLEQQGYQVLTAPSGEAGLALARATRDPIHLLLTDVIMPGLSGPKLADLLLAERPGVRVIYMSGYAANTLEQRLGMGTEAAFLQKPFTPEQLVRRVQAVLEGTISPATPPPP